MMDVHKQKGDFPIYSRFPATNLILDVTYLEIRIGCIYFPNFTYLYATELMDGYVSSMIRNGGTGPGHHNIMMDHGQDVQPSTHFTLET